LIEIDFDREKEGIIQVLEKYQLNLKNQISIDRTKVIIIFGDESWI